MPKKIETSLYLVTIRARCIGAGVEKIYAIAANEAEASQKCADDWKLLGYNYEYIESVELIAQCDQYGMPNRLIL